MVRKILTALLILAAIVLIALAIDQFIVLRKAHSSFENYYAFRGCTALIDQTNDYGLCKTSSGQIIKIVKYNNRWYLANDLPGCFLGFCF